MQFPILAKDLRLSLRRLESFISAFTFYSVMTVTVGFLWEVNVHGSSTFEAARDRAARSLFLGFIVLGFFGFCYHAALSAARILVVEREKNTFALLQATPLSGWKLILEKLFTPLVFELLLFFGVFPALALVFIIGGISPGEYAYQLTNLFVWILTSVILGLWISSRAKTSAKAVRSAILYLTILGPFLPLLSNVLNFFAIDSTVYRGADRWLSAPLGVTGFLLYSLSPAGMVFSFYPDIANGISTSVNPMKWGFEFDQTMFLFNAYVGFTGSLGPASWGAHLILQLLLLRAASRNWKHRLAEGSIESKRPWRIGSSQVKGSEDEAPRSLPTGVWAFFGQEDRRMFRHGKRTRNLLFGIYVAAIAVSSVYLAKTGSQLACLGMILFFALGVAPASFRREREANTSVFLVTSPHYPRSYLLAKWVYFMSLGYVVWAIAIVPYLLVASVWAYRSPVLDIHQYHYYHHEWIRGGFRNFMYIAALIPMISLEGLMIGLRIRKKIQPIRFLIPIGVLAGGWVLIALLQWLNRTMGNRLLWRISNYVYYNSWIVGVYVPYLLILGGAVLLLRGVEAPKTEPENRKRLRIAFAKGLILYTSIDLLTLLVFAPNFDGFDARNHLRGFLAAATFNWLPWVWLVRRPESWWRERLLGPEAA
jgi:hypothetical protein